MNPLAPFMAAYAAVIHILPMIVIPAILLVLVWKAAHK